MVLRYKKSKFENGKQHNVGDWYYITNDIIQLTNIIPHDRIQFSDNTYFVNKQHFMGMKNEIFFLLITIIHKQKLLAWNAYTDITSTMMFDNLD